MNATATPRRFLFVGGGTGGHLTPALGLAEELERRGHRCFFLVSGRAVEEGYFADRADHASLQIDRSRLPKALAILAAMLRLRAHARSLRPHAVIVLGGASSIAAYGWRKAPHVLLEGNLCAGKAVRWMQRGAAATLTLFPATADGLRRGHCVGPIGRAAMCAPPAIEARERLGLRPAGAVLLTAGGSQGARDINDFARELLPELAAMGGQLLALTGVGKVTELQAAAAEAGVHAVVLEHCSDMGAAYAAADFAVLRGGASTMAELLLTRLPALILPYPYHKDRQQFHNAAALEPGVRCAERGDGNALCFVAEALRNPELRAQMRAALEAAAPADGAIAAATKVEEIAAGQP